MNKLEYELISARAKLLYQKIQDDLELAAEKYTSGDAQLADLIVKKSIVESNLLVADRVDVIVRFLIESQGD